MRREGNGRTDGVQEREKGVESSREGTMRGEERREHTQSHTHTHTHTQRDNNKNKNNNNNNNNDSSHNHERRKKKQIETRRKARLFDACLHTNTCIIISSS